MELLDWITLGIFFALGFSLGWRLNEFFHVQAMMAIFKQLNIKEADLRKLAAKHGISFPTDSDTAAEEPLEEIHVKIEQHGSEIYAFRADNDQFLGQGRDRETLIQHISTQLKNVQLIIDEGGELLQKRNT